MPAKISFRLHRKRNVSEIIKYLIKALPACIVGHKIKLVAGSSITASSNLNNLLRKVYITLLYTTIIDNLVIHCFHMYIACVYTSVVHGNHHLVIFLLRRSKYNNYYK